MDPAEKILVMDENMKVTFNVMNDLRKRKELCDITLKVGELELSAHKVVLASFSPYFYAMFTSDVVESRQNCVTLKSMDPKSVELLVEFAYTAKIRISEENVQNLLPTACILQIGAVKAACTEFLASQIDPTNCIGIKAYAEMYGCMDLFAVAKKFCFRHFAEVSLSEEFENLSKDEVIDFISRDELFVKSEDAVLAALLRWVTHDLRNKTQHFAELLSFIRLPFISAAYLKSLTHCYDQGLRTDFKDILIKALSEINRVASLSTIKKRRPPGPTVIFIAGGYLRRSLDILECFNPLTLKWTILSPLSVPKSGLGAAYIDHMLYIIGGRNNTSSGNVDTSSVERYDPLKYNWKMVSPLSIPRNRLGVGTIDGRIYAVGGGNGSTSHTSMERYDPQLDKWTSLASMSFPRMGVAIAVLDRKLYAIGGFDGQNRLRSVECYDVDSNTWTVIAPLAERRSGAGASSLRGFVYVAGGYSGESQLNSMERYHPESDTWTVISPLVYRRSALSLTAFSNKLYVIGGYDGEGFLNTLEEYDPDEDRWKLVSSLNLGRSGAAVAVGWKPASEW